MKRLVLLVMLALVTGGCIHHSDGTLPSPADPVKVTIVGDSLTYQYGPDFQAVGKLAGATVTGRWFPGTDPVDFGWDQWVTETPGVDYVILEDVRLPCCDVHQHTDADYLTGWQTVVTAARTALRPGGRVYVLETPHGDLSSVTGIDGFLPVVPPDDPDGVHWTPTGALAEARLLCTQLSNGDAC